MKKLGSDDGKKGVVVACLALKRIYRDDLRLLNVGRGAKVHFILVLPGAQDMHDSTALLKQRLQKREGHYMKAEMVDTQISTCEIPEEDEVNIVPVDVGEDKQRVLSEVMELSAEF